MKKMRLRKKTGQLLIELGASLPIIICMLGLSLNGMFGIMALLALDTACIDSARAASLAPTKEIAEMRAQLAVRNHNRGGIHPVSNVVAWNLNPKQTVGEQLKANPWLVVRTRVQYTLPIPMFAFGQSIGLRQELTLERSYAYPILNVERAEDQNEGGAARGAVPIPVPIAPALVAYLPKVPIIPDQSGSP